MRPGFPLAALMLSLPFAVAEEKAADYGDGLKQLAALGLPPMAGAEWVRKPKDFPGESFPESYEFRELGVRLQGSMWKLPGDPPRLLGFGTPEVTSSEPAAEEAPEKDEAAEGPGLLEKMLRNHAAKNPPKKAEAKPGLEVEEDVKLVVEAFGKPKVREEIQQQMEYGRLDLPARCLIFAAQLHHAGKPEAASRLANAIFDTAMDKAALIDAAVSIYANLEQATVTEAFFKDRDWKKYHESMKALLAKYPRGWDHAGAIAMLMPGLEKRAAGVIPPAPSLPGIELKPEAVAAIESMLQPPEGANSSDEELAASHGIDLSEIPAEHRQRYLAMLRQQGMSGLMGRSRGGLWLLEKPETPAGEGDPVGRLKAMGMDGLIALAAVATDDTLVPFANQGGGGRTYYGSSRSAEELATEKFQSMARPKTRGEVAVDLLKGSIPLGEEDADEMDDASVAEIAVAFWTQHHGKSGMDLALIFLSEGDDSQKSQAATYLANHEDPKAQQAFEKAVLGSDEPAEYREQVEQYLEEKKAAAKPFFEAYAKVLKESLDGVEDNELEYTIREAGGVEKYLKTLSMKVGAISLKELVATAMESGEESDIEGLASTMASANSLECLTAVGEVAGKATPAQLASFYQILLQLAYRNDEEEEGESTPPIPLPSELLDHWRPLISKTNPLPEKGRFSSWAKAYGAKTLGDGAAMILEVSAFPASGQQFNGYGDIHESLGTVCPFVRSRVEAWIDQKEPAAWPDESKVSEARKKEIADQLAKLPAKELLPFARSLPPDERMAFSAMARGFNEENQAPAGVQELRTTIMRRGAYNPAWPHDDAILDKLGITEGYQLGIGNLTSLAERLARDAKSFSGTVISFHHAPMGLGCSAMASRVNIADREAGTQPPVVARWFGQYQNPDAIAMLGTSNAGDFWGVKDGQVTKLESKQPADEALKAAFDSKSVRPPYITLQVITREDAEKLTNRESEEE